MSQSKPHEQSREQRLLMPNINHRSTNDRIENGLYNNKNRSTLQLPPPSQHSQTSELKPQLRQPDIHTIREDGNFFNVSRRSNVYDFRKNTLSSSNMKQNSNTEIDKLRRVDQSKQLLKPLTPIKENDNASISNIPPSRSIMDPDNNIMFLDNGSRIVNPINVKTPPPPMWGEILEEENYDPNEEFYDHQKALQEQQRRTQMQQKKERMSSNKRLKKKIVYVYESDSDEEQNSKEQKKDQYLTQSLIQNSNEKVEKQPQLQSKRGLSLDAFEQKKQQQSNYNSQFLPYINKVSQQSRQQNSLKPPLPSSQQNKFVLGIQSQNGASSRQIRTGGFQKLPTLGLLKAKI